MTMSETATPTRPTLVCMTWRGGERLTRSLTSIEQSHEQFDRIIISVTAPEDSDDMRQAQQLKERLPQIEVICTGRELPTMQHQAFWVDYLEATGTAPDDWIYWLAYDDEVRLHGIEAMTDEQGNWPLEPHTAYFGPWAMRHEHPDQLWNGDPTEDLESWTSFPAEGPLRLTVAQWIGDQLRQPTYMQMSGSVNHFRSFTALRDSWPRKRGPMRIEMAIAAAPHVTHVEEFSEPVSIIYGRSNSDRASYGKEARREDLHLLAWLARHSAAHPHQAWTTSASVLSATAIKARALISPAALPQEEWRVRGTVLP